MKHRRGTEVHSHNISNKKQKLFKCIGELSDDTFKIMTSYLDILTPLLLLSKLHYKLTEEQRIEDSIVVYNQTVFLLPSQTHILHRSGVYSMKLYGEDYRYRRYRKKHETKDMILCDERFLKSFLSDYRCHSMIKEHFNDDDALYDEKGLMIKIIDMLGDKNFLPVRETTTIQAFRHNIRYGLTITENMWPLTEDYTKYIDITEWYINGKVIDL